MSITDAFGRKRSENKRKKLGGAYERRSNHHAGTDSKNASAVGPDPRLPDRRRPPLLCQPILPGLAVYTAGILLGALLGYDAIDEKWKRDLELRDVILEMADDLYHGCQIEECGRDRDPDWSRKYIHAHWKDTPSESR